MKKFLVMSALVGAFAFTSCASCDEEQATADFVTAATAHTNSFASMDCAAISAAWGDYLTAYNNMCDSQKEGIDWAAIEAAHTTAFEGLGC